MKPLAGKFYIKASGFLSKPASGSELKYSAPSQVPRAILLHEQSKTKICVHDELFISKHMY